MTRRVRRNVIIAALAAAAAWPGAAHAGTYTVSACASDAGPAPVSGWTYESSRADDLLFNECASGGAFGILVKQPTAGPASATWTFAAPADTTVTGLRATRRALSHTDTTETPAASSYTLAADGNEIESSPAASPATWDFGVSEPARQALAVSGLRAHTLSATFVCGSGSTCPGLDFVMFSRADVTLQDESLPSVTGLDGSGGLRVRFVDQGGGVERAMIDVDGVPQPGVTLCQRPFVDVVPCPLSGTVTLPIASGPHTVSVTLVDAAGNEGRFGQYRIDDTPSVSVPDAKSSGTPPGQVTVKATRTVHSRYSEPPRLTGTAPTRTQVTVETRPLGAQKWTREGTVTADGNGRFSYQLTRGGSREVRFSYGASQQTITVIVAAPVRLATDRRAVRNRHAVRFSGSVPGARDGALIELQAWAGRWVPFRTVALRRGTFAARYRFTSTFNTTRYRFRAVLHPERGFAYASGRSATVSVLVRP